MSNNDPAEFWLYDTDLVTAICPLPVLSGHFYFEFNESGSGSINIPLDSNASVFIDDGQIVRMRYRGNNTKAFFVDSHKEVEVNRGENKDREMSINGRGLLAYL